MVLRHMGVLAKGQTADAADTALVTGAITASLEELATKDLVDYDASEIPEQIKYALRDYVAMKLIGDFQLRGDALNRVAVSSQTAEQRMKEQLLPEVYALRARPQMF